MTPDDPIAAARGALADDRLPDTRSLRRAARDAEATAARAEAIELAALPDSGGERP